MPNQSLKFKKKGFLAASLLVLTSLAGLTSCDNKGGSLDPHHIPSDKGDAASPYRPVKKVVPKIFEDGPGTVKYCEYNNVDFTMEQGKVYLVEAAVICEKTNLTEKQLKKKYSPFSNKCIKAHTIEDPKKLTLVEDEAEKISHDSSLSEEEKHVKVHECEHQHIFDEPSDIEVYNSELNDDLEVANVYKFYLKPLTTFTDNTFEVTFTFGEGTEMYVSINFSCK